MAELDKEEGVGRTDYLLAVMIAASGRELVVTFRQGAYVRDENKKFVAGPFEHEEYTPLVESGQLVDSKKWCSVYVTKDSPDADNPVTIGQRFQ